MIYDLFNPAPEKFDYQWPFNMEREHSVIKGLFYIPNFITKEEETELIQNVNSEPWLADIKRRVQHYGYKYDYKKRSLDYSMYIGSIPKWTKGIAKRIVTNKFMSELPDQVIVNEYLPGQGIADHIDCEPCFDNIIISLSLGSTTVMEFKQKKHKINKYEVLLEPQSLVVITDEARYNWSHGIPAREKDFFQAKIFHRNTRISLTFRKVILRNMTK